MTMQDKINQLITLVRREPRTPAELSKLLNIRQHRIFALIMAATQKGAPIRIKMIGRYNIIFYDWLNQHNDVNDLFKFKNKEIPTKFCEILNFLRYVLEQEKGYSDISDEIKEFDKLTKDFVKTLDGENIYIRTKLLQMINQLRKKVKLLPLSYF